MEDPLKRIPTGNKGLSSTCDVHSLPPREALLHSEFVRKYITFAKHNVDPELGEEARESIANAYADLRNKADDRTLPVTARCLESLIRIATAHAKVRLSALVDGRDCQTALKFLSFALYGDTQLSNTHVSPALVPQAKEAEAKSKRPRMSSDISIATSPQPQNAKRHKYVVDAYTHLASVYAMQGKVHISELLALADSFVEHWDKKFQLAEIELVLLDLQGLNRLMYDETNRDIHFL